MVIGESGVGKSSIVNMLFNQNTTDDCLTKPSNIGWTADSVTKQTSVHMNMERKWLLVDTIGVGDPQMRSSDLVRAIRGLLEKIMDGVECIVFVLKMERVTAASRANMALLQKIFSQQDLKTHGALVLTHWAGELGDEDRDIEEWADNEMKETMAGFAHVILANNKIGRGAYPEARQATLQKLNVAIMANRAKINVTTVTP